MTEYLRNKKTGVVFHYSDALAKLPFMVPYKEPKLEEAVEEAKAAEVEDQGINSGAVGKSEGAVKAAAKDPKATKQAWAVRRGWQDR